MKKLFIPLLFIIILFTSNVYALDSNYWDFPGVIKPGVDICSATDDDGVSIKCEDKPFNVNFTHYSWVPALRFTGMTGLVADPMYLLDTGNNDIWFHGTVPASKKDIFASIVQNKTTTENNTTVLIDSMLTGSFIFCSEMDINWLTIYTNNFNIDGYERIYVNKSGYEFLSNMICNTVYFRQPVKIGYLLPSGTSQAVPTTASSYRYLVYPGNSYEWNSMFRISRSDSTTGRFLIYNFQYLTINKYNQRLKDIGFVQNTVCDNSHWYGKILCWFQDIFGGIRDIFNSLNNSSTDNSAFGNYFNNFQNSNPGGISSIVTAPIRLINSFNGNCTNVNINIFNEDISLPCGSIFWGRNDVQSFRTFWNTLFGGAIIYRLLVKLFKTIEKLKDPDDDNVEVMDL